MKTHAHTLRRTRNPAVVPTRGLIVLGMHRSGTSALTRVLNLSGADLGSRLVAESVGNEAGHWENAFAVETNERLLSTFGRSWDDVRTLPRDWLRHQAAEQAAAAIQAYAGRELTGPLWAIKDPRLCRLAPLWIEALAAPGRRLSAVIVLRHPLEIAASLAARDGCSLGRSLLLWLRYMIECEAATRGLPRCFIRYEALLEDWRAALATINDGLGNIRLAADDQAGREIAGFLDRSRRHHRIDDDSRLTALSPPLAEVHRLFLAAADGREISTDLDRLGTDLVGWSALYDSLLDEQGHHIDQLWQRTARAEAQLADDQARVGTVARRLEQVAEQVTSSGQSLMTVLSDDIRRMQGEHAGALTAVNEIQGELAQSRQQAESLVSKIAALSADKARLEGEMAQSRQQAESLVSKIAALSADKARLEGELVQGRCELSSAEQALNLSRQERARLLQALETLRSSRSWRITRPLRYAKWWLRRLRAALRGQPLREPFDDGLPTGWTVQAANHPGAGAVATERKLLPPPSLAPADEQYPDVFVWAVIDWHFRFQRPQHLATALADKGHRVFYVSNNFLDSTDPGFEVEALDGKHRLFQVKLRVPGAPAIYFGQPDQVVLKAISASLAELLRWTQTRRSLCLVQHPFWQEPARMPPNHRVVYDCMDHHAGFENTGDGVLEAERRLIESADLVVASSQWLFNELAPSSRNIRMIRNAAEHTFFCRRPERVFRDPRGRPVIGYYGAIAEWFDLDLIRALAQAFPTALVLLVGNDSVGAKGALADLDNVQFTGEVPYPDLPYWLHGFDVCLLPFRVLPLTQATNPVKVYEYLSAGKPVVAVDLPEMAQFGALVRGVAGAQAFVSAVGEALAQPGTDAEIAARQRFASEQTWTHRAAELDEALESIVEPAVSVIVLTYNNLAFTEACLFSVEHYSDYSNLEVIVVDNASSDGSREFLQRWVEETSPAGHRRRLILNESNLGFAAGNNVGLAAARGEYLALLNNDTYVTPGWVRGLIAHLRRDPGLGLLGPVTNNIGNEARVEIGYADMPEMIRAAKDFTLRHPGRELPLRTAAFFCVAMPRAVYEKIGGLDEAFGIGFFEDDDYCRRVEQARWRIACAEDVFVHHHLSATFEKKDPAERQALFERNKAIYEAKWGKWVPHTYR